MGGGLEKSGGERQLLSFGAARERAKPSRFEFLSLNASSNPTRCRAKSTPEYVAVTEEDEKGEGDSKGGQRGERALEGGVQKYCAVRWSRARCLYTHTHPVSTLRDGAQLTLRAFPANPGPLTYHVTFQPIRRSQSRRSLALWLRYLTHVADQAR